ncbi:MAG: hypothetical protein KIY10_00430 [Thermoplasmata archaeon]|nr:hypothetical protein [Candidatus Sysuiplasma jiujiangense]MBX8641035.1 hypothetical protein [Candidatus Sysuiplasma jiujiangense]
MLQLRLIVCGFCNVDLFLTRNLCTVLAVTLSRLRHGVKNHPSFVAYLSNGAGVAP